MSIARIIAPTIKQELLKKELSQQESQNSRTKIIVIYGARQVGKTTLVESILKEVDGNILRINGDALSAAQRELLQSRDIQKLKDMVSEYDILFIDEGQKIHNIGINLKILYDHNPHLKIIVTGSSALDLANSLKEPLTGRTDIYYLYPISIAEVHANATKYEILEQLESRLIFGSYPEILNISNINKRKKFLYMLASDYLYKDVLELENILYHYKLRDLLQLLAFQIGNEVSYHELGKKLGLSSNTVANYIHLLEQAFVIFTLRGFSRNLRKEINKKPKIYFYDLGIRNSLIGNFNYLNNRNDIGALWENFLILERLKRNEYQQHFCAKYFWRTYTGAELDYVEENEGQLYGYEIKYQKTKKAPQTWLDTYNGKYSCINKDNFWEFIL